MNMTKEKEEVVVKPQRMKKTRVRKPTLNQIRALNEVKAQISRGEKINLSAAQRKAGYSEYTIRKSTNLTKSIGWRTLMEQFDDAKYMWQIDNIAMGDDKNASLKAIDMIMKLKDRYPAGKLKFDQYNSELDAISD